MPLSVDSSTAVNCYSDQQSVDFSPRDKYLATATLGVQADHIASCPEFDDLEKAARVFKKSLDSASEKFSALRVDLSKMRGEIYEFRETNTSEAYAVLKEGVSPQQETVYVAKLYELKAMQDSVKQSLENIDGSSVERMFYNLHGSISQDLMALAKGDVIPYVYTSDPRFGFRSLDQDL